MPAQPSDRVVYIDQYGDVQCASSKSVAAIPSEFADALTALSADLELALDCLRIFKGIPIPVAKPSSEISSRRTPPSIWRSAARAPSERMVH